MHLTCSSARDTPKPPAPETPCARPSVTTPPTHTPSFHPFKCSRRSERGRLNPARSPCVASSPSCAELHGNGRRRLQDEGGPTCPPLRCRPLALVFLIAALSLLLLLPGSSSIHPSFLSPQTCRIRAHLYSRSSSTVRGAMHTLPPFSSSTSSSPPPLGPV